VALPLGLFERSTFDAQNRKGDFVINGSGMALAQSLPETKPLMLLAF
jgi:hypothetical protein